jgi:superfamily II DNA or RNA helicase
MNSAPLGKLPRCAKWQDLKLWEHQTAAIKNCARFLAERKRKGAAMVQMPTGTGKTAVITVIAQMFPSVRSSLLVVPWADLAKQAAKVIRIEFWLKIAHKAPASGVKRVRLVTPTTLRTLLAKSNKRREPTVYVCTFATIERLHAQSKSTKSTYHKLAKLLDVALIDEGHREPAPKWGLAMRELKVPAVLFTATPYRNDMREFTLDPRYQFVFALQAAVEKRFLRHLDFHLFGGGRTPAAFAQEFVSYYLGDFKVNAPSAVREHRAIVRCSTMDEVREVAKAIRDALSAPLKQQVMAVHENFDGRVPGESHSAAWEGIQPKPLIWVHQFKMMEGLDDPTFCLLAFYAPYQDDRSVIQQIGRILRNPDRSAGQHAWVLCRSSDRIKRAWNAYQDYDVERRKVISQRSTMIQGLRYQVEYLAGKYTQFLEFDPTTLKAEDVNFPRKTFVYSLPDSFDWPEFQQRFRDELAKSDKAIIYDEKPRADTWLCVYAAYAESELLRGSIFVESRLDYVVARRVDNYLFYYDTTVRRPGYLAEHGTPIEQPRLERIFANKNAQVKGVSLLGADFSIFSPRRRSFSMESLRNAAPGLNDSSFIVSTANVSTQISSAAIESLGKEKSEKVYEVVSQRWYVGFSRGFLSQTDRIDFAFEDYLLWLDYVHACICLTSRPTADHLQRFAQFVRAPRRPVARHILLDTIELEPDYRFNPDVDSDAVTNLQALPELKISERASEVDSDGKFVVTVNDLPFGGQVNWSKEHSRFEIELGGADRLIRQGQHDEPVADFVRCVNKHQAFQILEDSGLFYSAKRFFRPRVPLWGSGGEERLELSQIIHGIVKLQDAKSEKGSRAVANGTKWEADSLFGMIQRWTIFPEIDPPDLLICDDLGVEKADFFAIWQEHASKVVAIHAKHEKKDGAFSASSFHAICAQATKSLWFLSPFLDHEPDAKKWDEPWRGDGFEVKSRLFWSKGTLQQSDGPGASLKIRELLRRPSTEREVWLVVGRGLAAEQFEVERKKGKPTAVAMQMLYQLQSCWNSVGALNAQLQIFCPNVISEAPADLGT